MDIVGTVLVSGGLFGIVYGFAHAAQKPGTAGWTDPVTIAFLVAGLVLLAAFVAWERRAAHPLLPLRVVLDRNRGGAYGAMFLAAPADDQEMLFRRYLTLILAGLRPAGQPLPGTAPSPAQAREAMRPGRLLRGWRSRG